MIPATIRASSLPLALKCPAAVLAGAERIDPYNPAAELGTAAHEALAVVAQTCVAPDDDALDALSARHGVDRDELGMLVRQGVRLWRQFDGVLGSVATEVPLRFGMPWGALSGHADVIADDISDPHTVHVLDWKTGRLDGDHREQLLAYAALALLGDEQAEIAHAWVLWVRDGEVERYSLARADLDPLLARWKSVFGGWDGRTYSPGAHCVYCPRRGSCDAPTALVRADVAPFLLDGEPVLDLAAMEPGAVVALAEQAGSVAQLAGRVRDAIKAHVVEHGDVVAPDGRRITLQVSQRRTWDPLLSWSVLEAHGFTDADFARAVTLRAGEAKKVLSEKAGRGHGAAAIRQLEADLDEAGAVTTTEAFSLVTRRS